MKNFKNLLKNEIEKRMKGGEVFFNEIDKLNGEKRIGVCCRRDNENMSPVVYLENYIKKFSDGESIEKIALEICDILEKESIDEVFDTNKIWGEAYVRDHIVYQIISRELNKEFLTEIPHRIELDFAMILRLEVQISDGRGTIVVNYPVMDKIRIPEEELFELAKRNTPILHEPYFQTMKNFLYGKSLKKLSSIKHIDKSLMYILTDNELGEGFGAGVIFYEGTLKKVCELLDTTELIIIPSSIHEVLILDEKFYDRDKDFSQIIKEVNRNHLNMEEVLGEHLYHYNYDNDSIV